MAYGSCDHKVLGGYFMKISVFVFIFVARMVNTGNLSGPIVIFT